jgi:hypothetical protein
MPGYLRLESIQWNDFLKLKKNMVDLQLHLYNDKREMHINIAHHLCGIKRDLFQLLVNVTNCEKETYVHKCSNIDH